MVATATRVFISQDRYIQFLPEEEGVVAEPPWVLAAAEEGGYDVAGQAVEECLHRLTNR